MQKANEDKCKPNENECKANETKCKGKKYKCEKCKHIEYLIMIEQYRFNECHGGC